MIVFAHISGWSGKCGEIALFFFLWWFFLLISACCFLMFFDDFDVRGRGITQFFNGKITILKTNAKKWWFGNVQSLELEEWCHFHIEIMSPMSLGSFCRFRCAKRRASEAKRRGAETQGLACSFLCSKSNRRWGYRYMPCIYDINNKSIYYMILYVCIYIYIRIWYDTWDIHDIHMIMWMEENPHQLVDCSSMFIPS